MAYNICPQIKDKRTGEWNIGVATSFNAAKRSLYAVLEDAGFEGWVSLDPKSARLVECNEQGSDIFNLLVRER